MKKILKSSSGLTLIELMLVLTITAVVSSFGIINIFNFKANQDLDNTAKEIVASLREANAKSITGDNSNLLNESWGVHFDNISIPAFYEVFNGDAYPGTTFRKRILNPGLEFEIPASNSSLDVLFDKLTGITNPPQNVKIRLKTDTSKFKIISINSNGSIDF